MMGGKRPGAGKPKGYKHARTVMQEDAKKALIQKVLEQWVPLVETKLYIALGEYTVDEFGNRRYTRAPDSTAISDLLHFVVGKPTQPIENNMSGSIDIPSIKSLADNIQAILGKKSQ